MKKILLFVLLLIGDCTIAFAQHQIPMQIINKELLYLQTIK